MLTAETAIDRLERAGETLMALPARGCFPAAFPTASLSHLIPRESELPRVPRPSARDVSRMDEAYGWVRLLPSATRLDVQRRRIVLMRSLVWPDSERPDPHVWSWRRLADRLGPDHHTVQRRHAAAIASICAAVNRMSPPCRATLARIQRF